MASKALLRYDDQTIEDPDIEWYSGNETYTRPRRIKINGVWEEVFGCEKSIRESICGQRETVFRCHIGDNRIIEAVINPGS